MFARAWKWEKGLMAKEHMEIFWDDEKVMYFDYSCGYMIVYICLNTKDYLLKMDEFI